MANAILYPLCSLCRAAPCCVAPAAIVPSPHGDAYGSAIAHALGFTHTTPCASTLHTIFGRLDCEVFEATLGVWADSVVAHTPAMPEAPEAAMAVDGKTLRGSKKQGAPGTHLLSVLAHRLGLTSRNRRSQPKPMRSKRSRRCYARSS